MPKLPCELGEEAFGVFPNQELPRFVKAGQAIQSKHASVNVPD